jgi:TrmH family RNA methyltransferase
VKDPAELPGRRVALVPRGGVPLRELAVDGDVSLLIGAERAGLPDAVLAACDELAHIPIAAADSLNAAMAATVALYDVATRMARP